MSGECNYCGGEHAEANCQEDRGVVYENGLAAGRAEAMNSVFSRTSKGEPMTKHTPEPWIRKPVLSVHGRTIELDDIDYARAELCVNACAGMSDPAAEIAAMREVVRVAKNVQAWGSVEGMAYLEELTTALKRLEGGGA